MTGSQPEPGSKASPYRKSRLRRSGPRLKAQYELSFDARWDFDDYEQQQSLKTISGLILRQTVRPSARASTQGKRMGKKGDVFKAKDVTQRRDRHKKEKDKLKEKKKERGKKRQRWRTSRGSW